VGREQLKTAMLNGQPSLVIIDKKGGSAICWNPETFYLTSAPIIVEIHDHVERRMGETVPSKLKSPMKSKKCELRANVLGFS